MMDKKGLHESPHKAATSTAVLGYAGIGDDLAEGQAPVSLPRYGSRPELNAPFLPSKKVKQLLSILSALKDVDIADLSYEINCYVPRQQAYRAELDLPIALGLLSSYLQRSVPAESILVEELHLIRRIRPPEARYLAALGHLFVGPQRGRVKTVYLSDECADQFGKVRPDNHGPPLAERVSIRGFPTLEDLLTELWSDLFTEK